jgi:hypothetical protein
MDWFVLAAGTMPSDAETCYLNATLARKRNNSDEIFLRDPPIA